MPIFKYNSFQEASEHLQELLPSDPFDRLKHLEKIIGELKPHRKIQRGIIRFKSIEDANLHRANQNTQ